MTVFESLRGVHGLTVLERERAALRHHTRFGLGGPCLLLADASSESAFVEAYRLLASSTLLWTSIGRGTNLVVSDRGYDGAILRYSAASMTTDSLTINVDAGAELNDFIDFANDRGLAGLEAMAGVPGWVGAAIYGNAGAYGQSIQQRLLSARFFDGFSVREFSNEECGFRYRHSIFKEHKAWQILSARFGFAAGDAAALLARSRSIRATRDAKFPPSMKCAGSIFKNLLVRDLPEGIVPSEKVIEGKVPAGWFLEQVGACGFAIGGIRVADYHGNLIYNAGGGTADQLVELLGELKRRVGERFGITLEEEVQFLGVDSPPNKVGDQRQMMG